MFVAGKSSQPEIHNRAIFRALPFGDMLNAEPVLCTLRSAGPAATTTIALIPFFFEYPKPLPEIWRHLRRMEFSLAEAVLSQADRHLKEVYPHAH